MYFKTVQLYSLKCYINLINRFKTTLKVCTKNKFTELIRTNIKF